MDLIGKIANDRRRAKVKPCPICKGNANDLDRVVCEMVVKATTKVANHCEGISTGRSTP